MSIAVHIFDLPKLTHDSKQMITFVPYENTLIFFKFSEIVKEIFVVRKRWSFISILHSAVEYFPNRIWPSVDLRKNEKFQLFESV